MAKKILVIAPHPDDEVLGCGATIAKNVKNGNRVDLCIVTRAYTPDWTEEFIKERKREIKRSTKILGITNLHLLNYPTVKLDTIPQKNINDSISRVLEILNPNELYIPHRGDLNLDHRIVHDATLVATRPYTSSVSRVLSYETLSETDFGEPLRIPFSPTVYECLHPEHLHRKLEAMKAYASELKSSPHPRSINMLTSLAQKRGSESGVNLAESFMLIREVKK